MLQVIYIGDWKRMTEFDRLLLFRALRPDRLTVAMRRFVAGVLGTQYTPSTRFDLEIACQVKIGCLHFILVRCY